MKTCSRQRCEAMTLASRRKRRDSSAAQVNTYNVNSLTDANGSNRRTWSKGDPMGFTLALLKAYIMTTVWVHWW